MRKLILLVGLSIGMLALSAEKAEAQTKFKGTVSNPTMTYANTGVDTSSLRIAGPCSANGALSIQLVVIRNSGTLAGTSILQASVNGVDFVALDTLTHSNVARSSKIYKAAKNEYVHYRVISTGSGTMNATAAHEGVKN